VVDALKVRLLGGVATKIEVGGTSNPAAVDAYLRGRKTHFGAHTGNELQTAIAEYSEAVRLDARYALAYANRSIALTQCAGYYAKGPEIRKGFDKAQKDALKVVALAPDLAEAHLARGFYFEAALDFNPATEEYERAVTLAPGNARILGISLLPSRLQGRAL
jgi:tetratricopeptide (TPR) repeat protein